MSISDINTVFENMSRDVNAALVDTVTDFKKILLFIMRAEYFNGF